MAYELSSGQLAEQLRADGVVLSASTVQRYARTGVIPCRPTPRGRYRFDLIEVRAALEARPAVSTLAGPPLTGGLGTAELPTDSLAEQRRRRIRGHVSRANDEPVGDEEVRGSVPTAVSEQLAHASRRSLALV